MVLIGYKEGPHLFPTALPYLGGQSPVKVSMVSAKPTKLSIVQLVIDENKDTF